MDELSAAQRRFDNHEIIGVLGSGGMGVVFEARESLRGELVAIKCLSVQPHQSAKARARASSMFEREYHSLAQLAHPHIIRVYDFAVDDSGPYYIMERLQGCSLRELAPLPWRRACSLIRDVTSALSLVHSRALVHRDVTPLNIHCTPDERAKLIDFGAMIPVGVPPTVVGTPAFVAPECLQAQQVDGRSDLFSLGACLYYALTGHHAYPAHTMAAVPDLWRTAPVPVSVLAPDVPPALEQLVTSLLSLQPTDRPRTAAEVYEQLTTLAQLDRGEADACAAAYLTTPKLVGRDAAVARLRRFARRASNHKGGSIVISGAPGLGRSRMLEAAALQSQVTGLRVARADASAGSLCSFAVVFRLLDTLCAQGSDISELKHALDRLQVRTIVELGPAATLDAGQRERILHDLTETLLHASERTPCALLVDDVHMIDEPSLAFLVGIAVQKRSAVLLVTTRDCEAELPSIGAARLLVERSESLVLEPLTGPEVREVLFSAFGEIPNIEMLATLLQRRCGGRPRLLMAGAQRLVDMKLVRYESGAWAIHHDPNTLARATASQGEFDQRLVQLPDDARALLEVIAFDHYGVLSLAGYRELIAHMDTARLHHALSELERCGMVHCQDDHVRLRHPEDAAAVRARLTEQRSTQLHERMATHCASLDLSAAYEAYHWLEAGQLEFGISAIDRFAARADADPTADVLRHQVALDTTTRAGDVPEFPSCHPARRAKYLALSVLAAANRGKYEYAAQRCAEALTELARFSGLADYAALVELPPEQRLGKALECAAARCSSPGVGGLDLAGALRRQAQLSVVTASAANAMALPDLLDAIPDLRPFHPLSPALSLATHVIDALAMLARGQLWRSWDALAACCATLNGPEGAALDPLTRMALHRVTLPYLSGLHADLGSLDTPPLLEELAQMMPDLAENQRARWLLALGDMSKAIEARRRFELLFLQAGGSSDVYNVELSARLTIDSACDDGLALRRTERDLEEVVRTRPGFSPRARLARIHRLRCEGQTREALTLAEGLLADLVPPHAEWTLAAGTQLQLLIETEQFERVLELGTQYLQTAFTCDLPQYRIRLPLAVAHCKAGQPEPAQEHVSAALAELQQRRARGVIAGIAHETAARIALARRDVAALTEHVEACAAHFKLGHHPALSARYIALLRDAKQQLQAANLDDGAALPDVTSRLWRLALQTQDDAVFYRTALALILQRTAASSGVLYRCEGKMIARVACLGAVATDAAFDERLQRRFAAGEAVVHPGLACYSIVSAEQPNTLFALAMLVPPVGGSTDGGTLHLGELESLISRRARMHGSTTSSSRDSINTPSRDSIKTPSVSDELMTITEGGSDGPGH